jgi:hypothetical protein
VAIPDMHISLFSTKSKNLERKTCLYNDRFQNKHHTQLMKMTIRGFTALEQLGAKLVATGV